MSGLTKGKKKGFTLIELIIVIAIIAILAAIAVPKFSQITKNANVKADVASAKTIHQAASQALAEDPATKADNITTKTKDRLAGGNYPTPKAVSGQEFSVTMDSDNNIKVTVGTGTGALEVYPTLSADYGK
ncbi:prepilin-type N-terminal cleavage/methylation domain-containing protein [Clostridium sp. SHJSY1]|nr:prepilin-type N-terminal cleavage/methylation domain-containing protein [Clostridium sp. SHJSY1]